MTMIYDPPTYSGSGQTPPWHGPEGPGGPGGPSGYGGEGNGPRHPVHRFRHRFLLAATAVVVGLGTFFGMMTVTGNSGNTILTTAQVAHQTDPGLVDVVSTLGLQQAASAGTGLVLTPSGEILTNNHVIKGATSIRVTDIGNGRSYPAKVVGYDQSKDIAVLQLVGASGLQTVSLGNSSTVKVGDKVVALGNAGGKGGTPHVAAGKVAGLEASIVASDESSGTAERLTGLIRHNAPIQPGDSGGPLVSNTGKVIGIDTAGSSSSSSGFQFQGGGQAQPTQAFAIPINEAMTIAHQIEAGQASDTVHIGATGILGVQVMSADQAAANGISAGSGAVIAGTVSGMPADRAGLAQGDVIISADGHQISSPSALQTALEGHHPGDSVRIGWTDQFGQSHSATLVLANGPAA
jgi:S1-C subfamily serine protease